MNKDQVSKRQSATNARWHRSNAGEEARLKLENFRDAHAGRIAKLKIELEDIEPPLSR